MQFVFIHGSGGTEKVWKFQLEAFPEALAVTLPGRPAGTPCESIESAALWLRGELKSRSLSKLFLVGHSLGGAVALQYALDYPDEVAALGLIGSGARLRVHPATLEALGKATDRPEFFDAMMKDSWSKAPPEFAREMLAEASALGPGPFLADLEACDRFDIIERIAEIHAPTLAITGTEDVMTPPKYAEFLRDKMPNASLELIEGGTHFVFAEFPKEVNEALSAFNATLADA